MQVFIFKQCLRYYFFIFKNNKIFKYYHTDTDKFSYYGQIAKVKIVSFNRGLNFYKVEYQNKFYFLKTQKEYLINTIIDAQIIKESSKNKELLLSDDIVYPDLYFVLTNTKEIKISAKIPKKLANLIIIALQNNFKQIGIIVRTRAIDINIDELIQKIKFQKQCFDNKNNILNLSLIATLENLIPLRLLDEVVFEQDIIYKDLKSYNKIFKLNQIKDFSIKTLDFRFENNKYNKNANIRIDELESLTCIDVNSGYSKHKNHIDMRYSVNLSAIDLIIESIINLNISGIVIIDFINQSKTDQLKLKTNMLNRFNEYDIKIRNLNFTKLGLCELSIKRTIKSYRELINKDLRYLFYLAFCKLKQNNKANKIIFYLSIEYINKIHQNEYKVDMQNLKSYQIELYFKQTKDNNIRVVLE